MHMESSLKNINNVTINTEKNVIVIGDIHGCFYTLSNLLLKLGSRDGYNIPEKYVLVSVGDLNNKGPHSIKVLQWAIEMSKQGKLYVTDSNHGRRLARRIYNECKPGGIVEKTFEEIESNYREIKKDIAEFLGSLPASITIVNKEGRMFVAHAAFSERLSKKKILEIKERNFIIGCKSFNWRGKDRLIVGHLTMSEGKRVKNKNGGEIIYLDGGVNEGRPLYYYNVESDTIENSPFDNRDI